MRWSARSPAPTRSVPADIGPGAAPARPFPHAWAVLTRRGCQAEAFSGRWQRVPLAGALGHAPVFRPTAGAGTEWPGEGWQDCVHAVVGWGCLLAFAIGTGGESRVSAGDVSRLLRGFSSGPALA